MNMSVLVNFAIFPTDKGHTGLSTYVARVERAVRALGYPTSLGPMSTVVEAPSMTEALRALEVATECLTQDCDRVYLSANFDIKKGSMGRMQSKVESVEQKLKG